VQNVSFAIIFCKSFLQNILFLVLFFVMIDVQGTIFYCIKCIYPVWEIYQASLDIGIIVLQISPNIPDSR